MYLSSKKSTSANASNRFASSQPPSHRILHTRQDAMAPHDRCLPTKRCSTSGQNPRFETIHPWARIADHSGGLSGQIHPHEESQSSHSCAIRTPRPHWPDAAPAVKRHSRNTPHAVCIAGPSFQFSDRVQCQHLCVLTTVCRSRPAHRPRHRSSRQHPTLAQPQPT